MEDAYGSDCISEISDFSLVKRGLCDECFVSLTIHRRAVKYAKSRCRSLGVWYGLSH